MENQEKIYAVVKEAQAIDFTKVYKILVVKTMQAGKEYVFDTAGNEICISLPTKL